MCETYAQTQCRKQLSVCRMLEVCCFFFSSVFGGNTFHHFNYTRSSEQGFGDTCGCVTDFQLVQTALSLLFLHSYSRKARVCFRAKQSSVVRCLLRPWLYTVLGMKVFAFVLVVLPEEKGIGAQGVGAPWGDPPCIQVRACKLPGNLRGASKGHSSANSALNLLVKKKLDGKQN